jgi:protein involved in polysaccharide export with SLBB domain
MASFQDIKDNALSYLAVGMIGMMWYDIRLMNTKIDSLMAITAESKIRIDNLERQVYKVGTIQVPQPPYKLPLQVKMIEVVGIRPEEQDNKIKKYLTKI